MITQNTKYDVAIVGGGPAGIMAAIFAAKTGAKVVLLEKNETIGRKILATGNGRCNVSNKNITINRYHGTDTSFAEPILASFNATEFFENIGVLLKEEDRGRLFPRNNQASSVVEALKEELGSENVDVLTNFTVKKIIPPLSSRPSLKASGEIPQEILSDSSATVGMTAGAWTVTGEDGDTITTNKLILTTGGKAAHQFGSSGDGLFWAKNMGHSIVPIHAALVPLETEEAWVKEIMGIKLESTVRLLSNDEEIAAREGDIIFTHFGISGPAAMGLARDVDPLLLAGKRVQISIDITPELSADKLDALITSLAAADGKKMIRTILAGLVPKNLVPQILALARTNVDIKAAELSRANRQGIIQTIKDFRLTVSKVRPLKDAQVTAGGIATSEVKPTLESKLIPNLYFAGEILDIDGDSGGFNLQWAWSSGKVAGEAVGAE